MPVALGSSLRDIGKITKGPATLFDPLTALGGLPSISGGDAAPAVSRVDGDSLTTTGIFQVGEGNKADQPSGAGGGGALVSSDLIVLAGIGVAGWIIATALRR